jgi:hypothetical protein
MTLDQARKLALNPSAFWAGDTWVVLSTQGRPVEGHPSKARAERAAMWCNEHETLNGRPAGYTIQELEK